MAKFWEKGEKTKIRALSCGRVQKLGALGPKRIKKKIAQGPGFFKGKNWGTWRYWAGWP